MEVGLEREGRKKREEERAMARYPRDKILAGKGASLQRRLPEVTEDMVAQCRGDETVDMEALYYKRKARYRLPNG
jgi:hypothetical protein